MTDTVNVSRGWLEKLLASNRLYSFEHNEIRATLTAAPKAEPVSDPYKLERAAIVEAVKVAMNDAWCDITSDTGCWPADLHRTSERGPVRIEYRPAIWTETTAGMVANILAQPEAPKVEQEPVICHHEAYQGSCAHCGVKIVNGFAVRPKAHPAPYSDELLEAADHLVNEFAWSAVVADCEEARKELQQRINRLRAAIAKHKGPQS